MRQSLPLEQQSFHAILSGRCEVFRGGAVVALLGPGDCFGEAALLSEVPSPVGVRAKSDVRLLVMPGQVGP